MPKNLTPEISLLQEDVKNQQLKYSEAIRADKQFFEVKGLYLKLKDLKTQLKLAEEPVDA